MSKSNFSVTQHGAPLDPTKYTWVESTQTFSTRESNLVLDFSNYSNCIFHTGSFCIFNTHITCTFNTGANCTFNTGCACTFNTGDKCMFNVGSECTFNTGSNCTFDVGGECMFTVGKNCVIVRRDIFEVIQPVKNVTIKLNRDFVTGFTTVETKEDVLEKLVNKLRNLSKEELENFLNK